MELTNQQQRHIANHEKALSRLHRASTMEYDQLWDSFGDFSKEVSHSNSGLSRLKSAVATKANESAGSDGGFAVPTQYHDEIVSAIKETSLMGMVDVIETGSNNLIAPVDETAPWDTTNGIQASWEIEGLGLNESKPRLTQTAAKLHKLTCFIPATTELAEDSAMLGAYLKRQAAIKLGSKMNDAILNGTGTGMPLGILSSPCLISVDKDGSQTADTVTATNITRMLGRFHATPGKGIWLVNHSAMESALNGLAAKDLFQDGKICGLPVIPCQQCKTLGDKGDIILGDFSAYQMVVRAGGLRMDVSTHLLMDYDIVVFRFDLRITGQPWWSAPASPLNGSNSVSPFVALAERA